MGNQPFICPSLCHSWVYVSLTIPDYIHGVFFSNSTTSHPTLSHTHLVSPSIYDLAPSITILFVTPTSLNICLNDRWLAYSYFSVDVQIHPKLVAKTSSYVKFLTNYPDLSKAYIISQNIKVFSCFYQIILSFNWYLLFSVVFTMFLGHNLLVDCIVFLAVSITIFHLFTSSFSSLLMNNTLI